MQICLKQKDWSLQADGIAVAVPIPKSWMDSLLTVIDAYEKDLPNLMKRSEQEGFLPERQENGKQELGYWPTAGYLRSRTVLGSRGLGIERIGENNDSPGSDLIIKLVDEEDSRPLWITVWGGANTLAQAVWRVRKGTERIGGA